MLGGSAKALGDGRSQTIDWKRGDRITKPRTLWKISDNSGYSTELLSKELSLTRE
jgi:hypothetical protein